MKTKSMFRFLITAVLFICSAIGTLAQNITVTGRVTDAATAEPLIGAAVVQVDKNTVGTVTDENGRYSISVPEKATLKFSYIGYESKSVKVEGQSTIDVAMKDAMQELEEVVVIGYGTQKKADLTGAVAVVDMKEAKKTAATNIYEMLQGQVPGVSVATTSEPGAMSKVQIRGIGSLNSVGPLYVLDGMIVNDVNHLNPNEIESMQVLKDASAAAIYGARAANGVIIVTTKKGKKGQPQLDINATWSVSDMPKKIEMMNASQFMHYNEQAYLNNRTDWTAKTYSKDHIGQYIPNSDWQRALFQTGFTQDYSVMYSQGSENVNMAVGGGYMDQTGVTAGPTYQRFTARMNSDATFGILKIGENVTFQHTKQVRSTGGFWDALAMPSVIPIFDPDEPAHHKNDPGFGYGSQAFPTYTSNPIGNQLSNTNTGWNDRVIGNVFAEVKIWKYLTYKINFGVDAWFGRNKNIARCYTIRMGSGEQRYDDVLTDNRDSRATLVLDNTLNYTQSFGKHTISALVGHSAEKVNWTWLEAQGYDQKVQDLWEIRLVGTQNNMDGKPEARHTLSYFGRIDYNYGDRYLVQFNLRSDGSSKFGPDHRRGYFPSMSAGWRISEEPFMEETRGYLDNLKLRFSWGRVGDMQSLGNYSYIPTIDHNGPYEGLYFITGPAYNETIHDGATQATRVNVNLGWETKTTTNIGLDFGFFGNRLFGSLEWFTSKSTDLLLNKPIAWGTGIISGVEWTNYGQMRNSGFEFNVGYRGNKRDFNYSVSANVSSLKNEVLRLGEAYVMNSFTRSEVGRSISDFYLLQTAGIFQSMDEVYNYTATLEDGTVKVIQPNAEPGDVKYIDVNGDGQINDDDRTWSGSPLPKLEVGLNFTMSWKGFDFNMFWAGKLGNKIYNNARANLMQFNVDNIPADVTPWTWDQPSDIYPRMYATSTQNRNASDRFLENGSFFRLKNIQLGYTIPQEATKKIAVQKIRAYVSGSNLLTLGGYKGYDPDLICNNVYEQGVDGGQYPSLRQVNFGLQITF